MDPSPVCDLQIWLHRKAQWHDVAEGLVYGFYINPPMTVAECELCDMFGDAVADVQSILLDLELIRGTWITLDYFDNLLGWDLIPAHPTVEQRRPGPVVQWQFVNFWDTVQWTVDQGLNAHLILVEFGRNAAQGISQFGQDVVETLDKVGDSLDDIGDGLDQLVDHVGWHASNAAYHIEQHA